MTAAEWEPIERDLGLQKPLPDPQLEFRTVLFLAFLNESIAESIAPRCLMFWQSFLHLNSPDFFWRWEEFTTLYQIPSVLKSDLEAADEIVSLFVANVQIAPNARLGGTSLVLVAARLIYSTCLSALTKGFQVDLALELLEEMAVNGMELNGVLPSLCSGCADLSRWELALHLAFSEDIKTTNAALWALGRAQRWQRALRALKDVEPNTAGAFISLLFSFAVNERDVTLLRDAGDLQHNVDHLHASQGNGCLPATDEGHAELGGTRHLDGSLDSSLVSCYEIVCLPRVGPRTMSLVNSCSSWRKPRDQRFLASKTARGEKKGGVTFLCTFYIFLYECLCVRRSFLLSSFLMVRRPMNIRREPQPKQEGH